jgi:hypothetical protein
MDEFMNNLSALIQITYAVIEIPRICISGVQVLIPSRSFYMVGREQR